MGGVASDCFFHFLKENVTEIKNIRNIFFFNRTIFLHLTYITRPWPLYLCDFSHSSIKVLGLTRPLYDAPLKSYGKKGPEIILRVFTFDLEL